MWQSCKLLDARMHGIEKIPEIAKTQLLKY